MNLEIILQRCCGLPPQVTVETAVYNNAAV